MLRRIFTAIYVKKTSIPDSERSLVEGKTNVLSLVCDGDENSSHWNRVDEVGKLTFESAEDVNRFTTDSHHAECAVSKEEQPATAFEHPVWSVFQRSVWDSLPAGNNSDTRCSRETSEGSLAVFSNYVSVLAHDGRAAIERRAIRISPQVRAVCWK